MRPGISTMTSTKRRSAPRPARSADIAMSMLEACCTFAPPCMASLVASESCPSRAPTISKRILGALYDFGHCDTEAVFEEHDLAARHEALVDKHFHCLA